MDLERLPGESGLDCGHPQMLGSSSALSARAEEQAAPVLTQPLPYRATRMHKAKVAGQRGWAGKRAHQEDPGCTTAPYGLPLSGTGSWHCTLLSLLHLPDPSHRPRGVSESLRPVTTGLGMPTCAPTLCTMVGPVRPCEVPHCADDLPTQPLDSCL